MNQKQNLVERRQLHKQKLEEWQQLHQQKLEERQQQLFMELHKQQKDLQQFTLQKTELQQKQFEDLFVNSLNGSENSEKDTIFSQSTIYDSIQTCEYVPEKDKTFEAFYRRYEDIFNVD